MAKYISRYTDTLSFGRFKVAPGAVVPEVPLSEDETICVASFFAKQYLVLAEPVVAEAEVVDDEVVADNVPDLITDLVQAPVKPAKRNKRNANS